MNLLPRLRYILEVCHPAAPTVQDVLDILTRISQHSTQTANKVIRCPRLMEAIFANFLPLSWKTPELKTGAVAYGQPVTAAMTCKDYLLCRKTHGCHLGELGHPPCMFAIDLSPSSLIMKFLTNFTGRFQSTI